MSWSSARHHLPSSPAPQRIAPLPRSARNEYHGSTAYERERANIAHYGSTESERNDSHPGRTELDVLRENLRFIRDESERDASWEARVAQAYEAKLFKEYAVIDLKHYKSGRIALRWRTAQEVVASIGEASCASLRCKWHSPPRGDHGEAATPRLTPFELPFGYDEGGQRKSALVKVKLCENCAGKLMWRDKGTASNRVGHDERRQRDNEDMHDVRVRRQGQKDRSRSPDSRKRHAEDRRK